MKTKTLSAIVLLLFGFSNLNCINWGDDEIHLIPDGFVGPVVIIFNQENGASEKWENDKRVYEIPLTGVLKTQFPVNDGFLSTKYYYYRNDKGGLTELQYTFPEDDVSPNSIQVFSGAKGVAVSHKTKKDVLFMQYIVGRASDSERLDREMNSIDVGDL